MSSIKITLYSGETPEITGIAATRKEHAEIAWEALVGTTQHLLRHYRGQMSAAQLAAIQFMQGASAQLAAIQFMQGVASEQGLNAQRATLINTQAVRKTIDTHCWSTKTTLALVLEYLRQHDLEDPALDALIVHLADSGKAFGLITFLQDCAMTGTDKEIE